MILSSELQFSDSQVVTTTAASTNLIGLTATGTVLGAPAALVNDLGKGKVIPINVSLDIAATGTSPTLVVSVEMDTAEGFPSATTVFTAPLLAGGAAGDEIEVFIPEGTTERFFRLMYTTTGTTPSYQITASVVADKQTSDGVPGV